MDAAIAPSPNPMIGGGGRPCLVQPFSARLLRGRAVAPGPVQTGWISPDLEEQLLPWIPLGQVGRPEDVADAIVFLASEQARWITSQVLHVAGRHAL